MENQIGELESIQMEEQDAYDNLPESLMYSERGEAMEENASDLDDSVNVLHDIIDVLQEILER